MTNSETPRPFAKVVVEIAADDAPRLARIISRQPVRNLNVDVHPQREVLGQSPQPPRSAGDRDEVDGLEFLEDEEDDWVREVRDLGRAGTGLLVAPCVRTTLEVSSAVLCDKY